MSYCNHVQQAILKLAPSALCNVKNAKLLALVSRSYQGTEEVTCALVTLQGVLNEAILSRESALGPTLQGETIS